MVFLNVKVKGLMTGNSIWVSCEHLLLSSLEEGMNQKSVRSAQLGGGFVSRVLFFFLRQAKNAMSRKQLFTLGFV